MRLSVARRRLSFLLWHYCLFEIYSRKPWRHRAYGGSSCLFCQCCSFLSFLSRATYFHWTVSRESKQNSKTVRQSSSGENQVRQSRGGFQHVSYGRYIHKGVKLPKKLISFSWSLIEGISRVTTPSHPLPHIFYGALEIGTVLKIDDFERTIGMIIFKGKHKMIITAAWSRLARQVLFKWCFTIFTNLSHHL